MSKMAKQFKQRIKNVFKSGSRPPKSAKIFRKLKNHVKIITEIRNRLKQRSKTWPKHKKHAKITNRIKQRSQYLTIFEKSPTWAQQKSSKSSISIKRMHAQNGKAHFATDQKRAQNDRRRRERAPGFYGGVVDRHKIHFSAETVLWMWWNR